MGRPAEAIKQSRKPCGGASEMQARRETICWKTPCPHFRQELMLTSIGCALAPNALKCYLNLAGACCPDDPPRWGPEKETNEQGAKQEGPVQVRPQEDSEVTPSSS